MFENMNPLDRPTAFLEIGILLLITFVLGYLCAYFLGVPSSIITENKKNKSKKVKKKRIKKEAIIKEEEYVDPRDIITEPTEIKAVLTRDRKGNAIDTLKTGSESTSSTFE